MQFLTETDRTSLDFFIPNLSNISIVSLVDANEYMAFGLSKNDTKSEMIGADAVVAYFDETTGKLKLNQFN